MIDNKTPEIQTIINTINKAQRIAIVLPQLPNIDLVAAAFAISTAVESLKTDLKKTVMIFSTAQTWQIPPLPFIKNTHPIYPGLNGSSQLIIKVSNRNAQPSELRYEKGDDGLTIFINPEPGMQFQERDVTILPSATDFDLLIILGSMSFEQLGNLYTDNTKLFFETPHINIDINPANEFFGTVNLVKTTASSVSEVVMDILEQIPGALESESVSTALLAGIISRTSNFRDQKTTPQAFLKSARLIELGAKHQEIIQHLFKTKSLAQLQLWGRALARLTAFPEKQTLLAVVTKFDMEKTQVEPESLQVVVRDIIEMITGYSLVILLAELPKGSVQIILAGLPFEDLSALATQLKGLEIKPPIPLFGKYEYISVLLPTNLIETQETLNKIIKTRSSVV